MTIDIGPMVRGLAVVVLLATLSGCAVPKRRPARDPGDVERIERLQQEIIRLRQEAAMSEVEERRLQRRIADLEAQTSVSVIESVPAPVVTDAPLFGDEAEVEVTELPSVEIETPPSSTHSEVLNPRNGVIPQVAQELYDRGYTLFHQGRYLDSEATFQQFLATYSQTDLGDNAQFWIGEARYARGDVNGALSAFQGTVDRFPGGNKEPDAQLKLGDCLRELGDLEGAHESYRAVVRKFPNSAAAAIAEERLLDR